MSICLIKFVDVRSTLAYDSLFKLENKLFTFFSDAAHFLRVTAG